MFTIGSVRRVLMVRGSWRWNAIVRDVTAKIEGGWFIRSR